MDAKQTESAIDKRRPRVRRLFLTVLATAVLAATLGSVSSAGAAKFPSKFWGVGPQTALPESDYARMRSIGVDSVRSILFWPGVQPNANTTDFSGFDSVVRAAATNRLEVLPVLYGTPEWIDKSILTLPSGTAKQKAAWTAFLKAAAKRYGSSGSFWAENPTVPKIPLKNWQVWNEPNFFFFAKPVSPARYAALLKISKTALTSVDKGAKVIFGGLFAYPRQKPPKAFSGQAFLKAVYRVKGIKSTFDAVGLHPFAADASELPIQLRRLRATMAKAGDAKTPIWLTEVGWGSGKGTQFEKGVQGQVRELKEAFNLLVKNRVKWNIDRVFWFSWDDVEGSCNFCDSTGLVDAKGKAKPSYDAYGSFAKRF